MYVVLAVNLFFTYSVLPVRVLSIITQNLIACWEKYFIRLIQNTKNAIQNTKICQIWCTGAINKGKEDHASDRVVEWRVIGQCVDS